MGKGERNRAIRKLAGTTPKREDETTKTVARRMRKAAARK